MFGETLLDQGTQPRRIHAGMSANLGVSHPLSLILDPGFGFEIRGKHLDHTRNEIIDPGLGPDCVSLDEAAHQMICERVDLRLVDRHFSQS